MYDIGNLYEATSIKNAIDLLCEHPKAHIIAGGSDVLVQMREGKLAGVDLVSIYKLDEMRGITITDDKSIRIGSLTSFSHITHNKIIEENLYVLGEAVDQVGGPQVRNIGTIGGNTCNGVTSADSASTLFALDAMIEITGKNGVRTIPISEFYISAGKVALEVGDVQTAIIIPHKSYDGYSGYYLKYAMRNAMDISTLGCSVNVKLSADKTIIEDARIAFGVAGPIPLRAKTAEKRVKSAPINEQTFDTFAESILEDINPRDSWRATKAFRCHIGKSIAKRALEKAIQRAGVETHV
ncbi:MAG: xanthine dehydrogenase FAD-binding subunit XdhB [Epulopiscium sp. Nuni2H_MBin003]|nr:MAG: xanthine dehydrogenase FAD-binding subunit XdhB [Epulopiscium sp. Nuni2H_MBin003]